MCREYYINDTESRLVGKVQVLTSVGFDGNNYLTKMYLRFTDKAI